MDDPIGIEELGRRGISDPLATGQELVDMVRAILDVTDLDLADLDDVDNLARVAADHVLRPGAHEYEPSAVPELTGMSAELAARISLALGFPLVGSQVRITDDELETMRFFADLSSGIGVSPALQLARVVGSGANRLAHALGTLMRIQLELPIMESGGNRADVIRGLSGLADEALPRVLAVFGSTLRGHLVDQAGSTWSPDESHSAAVEDLTVGFADLEHFTNLAEEAGADELLSMVVGFESMATNAVVWHGGDVVKLIGDEVMFVVPAAEQGVRIARMLQDLAQRMPKMPRLRIALHRGGVVASSGDYYGAVVNVAARLVNEAEPGEILLTAEVIEGLHEEEVELRGSIKLRGLESPVAVFALA